MDLLSPWPAAVVLALCVLIGGVLAAWHPFWRARVADAGAERYEMLDGLRGFLALGVFFGHVATMYFYYQNGRWGGGPVSVHVMTAQTGVALFFMITGFLFWGRVLRGPLDTVALYRSRLRRLVPMYVASVLLVLAVVVVLSGFQLRETPLELARQLRGWFSFGFLDDGPLNGVAEAHAINAVYWTLAYEWAFYAALPLLALGARGRWQILLFAIAFVFALRVPVTLNFLCGAAAAVIVQRGWLARFAGAWWLSLVALGAFAFLFWRFDTAYGVLPALLLMLFFLPVLHGASLFGLLSLPASKVLGVASYSLYLTHCIVLFVVMRWVNSNTPVAELDATTYWSYAALAAALTVLLSAATYRWIEYPFLSRNYWWLPHARRASRLPDPARPRAPA